MMKSIGTLILLAGGALGLAVPVVTVAPQSPSPLVIGQIFEANVNVTGATDLYGYQLDLQFDPALIEAVSLTEGGFLKQGGNTFFGAGAIDNTAGTVSSTFDTLLTSPTGVSGKGTLFSVEFRALAAGISFLTISDGNGGLVDSNFAGIVEVATPGATPPIIFVPEANTLSIAPLVLGLLLVLRRARVC